MASDPLHAPATDPRFPGLDPAVVEAYLAAPPHQVAEILDGALHLLPRPRLRHARGATLLAGEFRPFYNPRGDDPGGWVILIEPELHLGHGPDVLVPDLAGWRRERVPQDFFGSDDAFTTLVPDWVCEVLSPSPSTEAVDRGRKRRIYRREGVGHLWLMDPTLCTLEVYRLENRRWVELETYEGDAPVRAEPFEAIELPLAGLWAR